MPVKVLLLMKTYIIKGIILVSQRDQEGLGVNITAMVDLRTDRGNPTKLTCSLGSEQRVSSTGPSAISGQERRGKLR